MSLDELKKLAREAEYGKSDLRVHPDTILELCALLEKVEVALEETTALCTNYEAVEEPDGYRFTEAPAVIKQGNEALAAIKQWKEQQT